jgi:cytoskeleton protein RodZ
VRGVTIFQRIRTPFAESVADDPLGSQPRLRQVGEALQQRREDLGLDLDEIGAVLRIKPAYLAALEQGRTYDLPGPAYAVGFVRAYSDYLGLNTEQILVRFRAEAAGITARPDLTLPVPLGERSLPGGALVLVALILALCGYGIWYYLSTGERDRPERVTAVPASLQPPVVPGATVLVPPPPMGTIPTSANAAPSSSPPVPPATTPEAAAPPQPAIPQPPPPMPPNPRTAAAPPPPASPAPPTATAQPAAATPAAPATPPAIGPAAAQAGRISIRALADCWIQVRAPDQSIVFSRVLKSGEVYKVPARMGLSLRTGNAGALEIDVDSKPAPSIGGIGTLRRDVALDPAALIAGTAVHG